MAARPAMRKFYFGLGIIVLVGAVFIAKEASRGGPSGPAAAILATAPTVPVDPGSLGRTLGSDSAPVEILEFVDFECPACARFGILEMPYVRERLVATGRLKWRFMDFPLQGHVNSPAAHLAAACAAEQGRFWEMHDIIYDRQNDWATERRPERRFRGYAERLGLDPRAYGSCVSERRAWPEVEAMRLEGERLGVDATPTFVINGRRWPGLLVYDQIRQIVDSLAPAGR